MTTPDSFANRRSPEDRARDERILHMRLEKKMMLREIADACGVRYGTVQRVLRVMGGRPAAAPREVTFRVRREEICGRLRWRVVDGAGRAVGPPWDAQDKAEARAAALASAAAVAQRPCIRCRRPVPRRDGEAARHMCDRCRGFAAEGAGISDDPGLSIARPR